MKDEPPHHRPSRAERARAFEFLCRALSRPLAATLLSSGDAGGLDWVSVIAHANQGRTVTNLAVAVAEHAWPAEVPEDVRDYLILVEQANAAQNRAIRGLVADVVAVLAGADIPFALLKGANWLLEVDDRLIGERMLSDIDLVVAPAAWAAAGRAMEAAGFRPAVRREIYERHFHHVPLARPGDVVTVEMHRHLGWQRPLLTPDEVVAAALPAPRMPQARLSSPTHRLIFGSLHAQLQNMEYAAGIFSLRDLCDIQHLVQSHGGALDWQTIANDARERGIFPQIAASLHLASRVLGVRLPPSFADCRSARFHVARCVVQHRTEWRAKAARLGVKIAWVLDSRRLAYELDCERSNWATRQGKISIGRLRSIIRLVGRPRVTAAEWPAD
jgi:hypothetical protein